MRGCTQRPMKLRCRIMDQGLKLKSNWFALEGPEDDETEKGEEFRWKNSRFISYELILSH